MDRCVFVICCVVKFTKSCWSTQIVSQMHVRVPADSESMIAHICLRRLVVVSCILFLPPSHQYWRLRLCGELCCSLAELTLMVSHFFTESAKNSGLVCTLQWWSSWTVEQWWSRPLVGVTTTPYFCTWNQPLWKLLLSWGHIVYTGLVSQTRLSIFSHSCSL